MKPADILLYFVTTTDVLMLHTVLHGLKPATSITICTILSSHSFDAEQTVSHILTTLTPSTAHIAIATPTALASASTLGRS